MTGPAEKTAAYMRHMLDAPRDEPDPNNPIRAGVDGLREVLFSGFKVADWKLHGLTLADDVRKTLGDPDAHAYQLFRIEPGISRMEDASGSIMGLNVIDPSGNKVVWQYCMKTQDRDERRCSLIASREVFGPRVISADGTGRKPLIMEDYMPASLGYRGRAASLNDEQFGRALAELVHDMVSNRAYNGEIASPENHLFVLGEGDNAFLALIDWNRTQDFLQRNGDLYAETQLSRLEGLRVVSHPAFRTHLLSISSGVEAGYYRRYLFKDEERIRGETLTGLAGNTNRQKDKPKTKA